MPLKQNQLLLSIFVLAFAVVFTSCSRKEPLPERPNIIFIFSDDHASHAVSAYGSEIIHTPNLDRLADEGVIFRNTFVTNSICAPSRGVLLTGKHSHINGQLTNAQTFDGTQMTYPQELQQAGYRTAMIGKWHLRSDPTGYDHWDILPGQGHYYNPVFITPEGENLYEGYVTDIITDKVIDWIDENRGGDQPFLVNYHHKAPHRNWKPGPDQLGMFDDIDLPEPETLFANWSGELSDDKGHEDYPEGEWTGRTSAVQNQEMTLMNHFSPAWDLKFPPDSVMDAAHANLWRDRYARFNDEQREAWDEVYNAYYEEFKEKDLQGEELLSWIYQRYVKDYLTTIVSIDENLGRLLDYLDKAGLADNTVVVYTSDQGFYLGDHGWYDKRWMYEESLHIPLMIRWPEGITPGTENYDLVQNLDFAPTLIDLAGQDIPENVQGRSLVPLMRGESPGNWRESIYYHYYEYPGEHAVQRHYGVRTDRYKLIHYYQIGEWELFDLEADPYEMRSVYDDPEYEQIKSELKEELYRLREHYNVPDEDPV
jgi:arylsulfatase A-like enzyme